MWTREEVKKIAKQSLKPYYWWAVLMCFIAGVLGGRNASTIGVNANYSYVNSVNQEVISGTGYGWFPLSPEELGAMIIIGVVFLIVAALAWMFVIFIGNAVSVGLKRYMIESRRAGQSAGVGTLFWVFGCGNYWNVIKIIFLKNLYTGLWSLLFIVPGIIKGYEYSMIPYLLAENPDMPSEEAFRLSKEMTTGEKWNLFVLDWSFIGWILLGFLVCCGVGGIFVTPYIEATYVEVYQHLKNKNMGDGYWNNGGMQSTYTCYENTENGRENEIDI